MVVELFIKTKRNLYIWTHQPYGQKEGKSKLDSIVFKTTKHFNIMKKLFALSTLTLCLAYCTNQTIDQKAEAEKLMK